VRDWLPRPAKLVLVLEGGYDFDALTASTGAVLSALEGGSFRPEEPTAGGPGRDMVDQGRRAWSAACERDGAPPPG
jgi:acetoin utilization deacetylase AcuC-like enzyme